MRISLEPDAKMLEEVVVVPYGGPVARKDLTGSVVSVNVEDMKALQAVTFENAIAGKVAGVQVCAMRADEWWICTVLWTVSRFLQKQAVFW